MIEYRNTAAGETLAVRPVVDGTLIAELSLEPTHHGPPAHVHPRAAERFTVITGSIRIRVGRERRVLDAGQTVLVPAGTMHCYEGIPGVPAHVLVELEPAGRMAEFFDDIYRIDPAHRDPRTGAPRMRAAAAVLRRYPQDIIIPGLPGFVLAVLAR